MIPMKQALEKRTNQEWLADLQAQGPARASALEDLRARLSRGVYYYLFRDRSDLCSRSSDDLRQMADDFAQDALLRVLDNLKSFRGESKFTTWSTKIALRIALTELRRVRWKDFSLDNIIGDVEYMPHFTTTSCSPSEPPNPETAVERQILMELVVQTINEALTKRQRTALVALVIEGMQSQEVADLMGTNRNALYKVMHDARFKMRLHMQDRGLSVDYIVGLFST